MLVASAALFLYTVNCYGISLSFLVLFAERPLIGSYPYLTAWKWSDWEIFFLLWHIILSSELYRFFCKDLEEKWKATQEPPTFLFSLSPQGITYNPDMPFVLFMGSLS